MIRKTDSFFSLGKAVVQSVEVKEPPQAGQVPSSLTCAIASPLASNTEETLALSHRMFSLIFFPHCTAFYLTFISLANLWLQLSNQYNSTETLVNTFMGIKESKTTKTCIRTFVY